MGLSFVHGIDFLRRRFAERDSGRPNQTKIAVSRYSVPATIAGVYRLTLLNIPPNAGPETNANPTATPNKPKFFARCSGGVISAI